MYCSTEEIIWNLWPFCGFLLIDNWKSVKKRNKNEHRNISIHVNCKPIYYFIFRFFLDNHYSYLVKVFFLPRIIIFYRKFMNLRWIGDDPLLHMFNFTKNIPLVSEIQNRRLGLFFMLMTLCLVLSWRKNFRTVFVVWPHISCVLWNWTVLGGRQRDLPSNMPVTD